MNLEDSIRSSIKQQGRAATFHHFSALNNADFLDIDLFNGRKIAQGRTKLHELIIEDWFLSFLARHEYERPVALIMHGGSGREEMVLYSDVDVDFLFDGDVSENNPFIKSLVEEMYPQPGLQIGNFEKECGFAMHCQQRNFDDLRDPVKFNARQINSFLDARPVYDPQGILPQALEVVKNHSSHFEQFVHNLHLWEEICEKFPHSWDNLHEFNIKEGRGGLRQVQSAMRIPFIERWISVSQAYKEIADSHPDFMESVDLMIKIRGWLHARRERVRRIEARENNKAPCSVNSQYLKKVDTLSYEDYQAFGDHFGAEAQERYLHARRIIETTSEARVGAARKRGCQHGRLTLGLQGLYVHVAPKREERMSELFELLRASQSKDLPIDISELHEKFMGMRSSRGSLPEFAELFYIPGKLSQSLEVLARLNLYNDLLPGSREWEASSAQKGHRGQFLTSTAFARQKVATYEEIKAVDESSLPPVDVSLPKITKELPSEVEAAVLLAFLTKRLPQKTKTSPREYLSQLPGFTERTTDIASCILENHDFLLREVGTHLNSPAFAEQVAKRFPSADHFKALYLFSRIDQAKKDETAHLWPMVDELYPKVLASFLSEDERSRAMRNLQPKLGANIAFEEEDLPLVEDLGRDVLEGRYGHLAVSWIPKFGKVRDSGEPIVDLARVDSGFELRVACQDYKGLMAVISGQCLEFNADIRQVYAYTLPQHGLVFDVFTLAPSADKIKRDTFLLDLKKAISSRIFIGRDPYKILHGLEREVCVDDMEDGGLLRLSLKATENRIGVLFASTYLLYRELGANIYAAKVFVDERGATNSIFFKPGEGIDFYLASELAKKHLGNSGR
ncbi:MAG: hypothetical protein Q8Q31_05290 [Nanoarchaeota archaeon]|nr:hypothetical protein [Nanoarchaeota archaeon]